ncbi:GTP-binding protein [Streptomyces sp. NPDC101062]|uniref:GTP-binding protein n=1 Tax=unclassified Streptomyces TaxID=2593676 RepID=UPI002E788614|nr:ATP/GTP-binding protein [Streptomyces sp. JV176]MEE1798114.1 ATP/GTP-binding protein [Streptomyces sp. JV176]
MPKHPDETGPAYLPSARTAKIKFLIAGGFAVGKTSFIKSVSEVRTLHTEERLTAPGTMVDSLVHTPGKTETTVGIDFGRRTLAEDVVLYLFGSPGQGRFGEAWQDAAQGAKGAVVLLDLRRPDESYEALDGVEQAEIPHILAVNVWPDTPDVSDTAIREDLNLTADTPLIRCNALHQSSCVRALIALTQHVLSSRHQEAH